MESKKRGAHQASFTKVSLSEVDNLAQIEHHDPTFDAYCEIEQMERDEIQWGLDSNHEVISSCVTVNWGGFEFAYDQFRARTNAEKRENYRWARGWVLPGRPDTRVLPDIACGFCGTMFRPASSREKFCSQKCSAGRFIKTLPCKTCGTPYRQMDRAARNGYCSASCGNKARAKVFFEFRGERRSLAEWARHLGLSYKSLENRRTNGWDVEKMLTTPTKVYKKRRTAECA